MKSEYQANSITLIGGISMGTGVMIGAGFFFRDQVPKKIQRSRCSQCGRYFSTQTFSVDYWLRSSKLLAPTFHRLVSCSGFRQIAREFGVSHSTIRGLSNRLGRHCL